MSIEALLQPEIIVPMVVFAAPVGFYWLKRHYALLEKAIPNQVLPAFQERLALLEAQNLELEARLRGLEGQAHALEAPPAPKALAAPAAAASDERETKRPR